MCVLPSFSMTFISLRALLAALANPHPNAFISALWPLKGSLLVFCRGVNTLSANSLRNLHRFLVL